MVIYGKYYHKVEFIEMKIDFPAEVSVREKGELQTEPSRKRLMSRRPQSGA